MSGFVELVEVAIDSGEFLRVVVEFCAIFLRVRSE